MTAWHLGIDIAGGEIVAGVSSDSSAAEVVLNGIPASVVLADDGRLIVGEAPPAASPSPDRSAGMLDRLVGTREPIFPGISQATAHEAWTAIFRWLVDSVAASHSAPPAGVCLAHPTRWRRARLQALVRSAEEAGIQRLQLVQASTAAASRLGRTTKLEDTVAVYILGATVSEATVLGRTAIGWTELGRASAMDIGAADLDRRLLDHVLVQTTNGGRASVTAALVYRAAQCREELSIRPTAVIELPDGQAVRVTRDEVEDLFTPLLQPSINQLVATIQGALRGSNNLAAVFVTGAASRFPLVDRLVSEAVGHAPTASDERYADVALGAAEISLSGGALPKLVPLVPARPAEPSAQVAPVLAPPARIAEPPARNTPDLRSTLMRPMMASSASAGDVAVAHRTVPRESRSQSLRRTALLIAAALALVAALFLLAYPGTLSGLFGANQQGSPATTSVATPPRTSPVVVAPAPTPSPTATHAPLATPPKPLDPAARLSAMVPAPPATNCRAAPLDAGDLAVVECEASDVQELRYALKRDRAALDADLAAIRSDMAAQEVSSDSSVCDDSWRYEGDPQEVVRGVLICFVWTDGAAFVFSTLDEALVINGMRRDDGELEQLAVTWRTLVPHPIDATSSSL